MKSQNVPWWMQKGNEFAKFSSIFRPKTYEN